MIPERSMRSLPPPPLTQMPVTAVAKSDKLLGRKKKSPLIKIAPSENVVMTISSSALSPVMVSLPLLKVMVSPRRAVPGRGVSGRAVPGSSAVPSVTARLAAASFRRHRWPGRLGVTGKSRRVC